jgi:endonuclease/exonuclease/phosphatase family metal-dependent hydrolase
MKVVTLNLWNINEPFNSRMEAIVERLGALDAEVIGLQEVTQTNLIPNQANTIGTALGLHVAVHPQPLVNREAGCLTSNAVLSRFPIVSSQWWSLPFADDVRGVEYAILEHPLGELHVFCTHLNYRHDDNVRREKQVVALHEFVTARSSVLPNIVMGDLNAEPDSAEIRFLRGEVSLDGRTADYRDAYLMANPNAPATTDGATWSELNPFAAPLHEGNRRIDYIFVSGIQPKSVVGEVRSACVVCDHAGSNGVFPSDHFGVLADLNFEAAAQSVHQRGVTEVPAMRTPSSLGP